MCRRPLFVTLLIEKDIGFQAEIAEALEKSIPKVMLVPREIADAMSDALGIHISEESENVHTEKEIWTATLATFASKFIFAMTFIIPVLFLRLETAILVSAAWGLSVLALASYILAKEQKSKPWKVIGEHLLVATFVIIVTHNVGLWIGSVFVSP